MLRSSITPGQPWLDTEGKTIQAHAGKVVHREGQYFWYGENKEHSRGEREVWHWGVRCYSSTDLYNWVDRGLIIDPVLDDEASPLHPSKKLDRPHIIWNEATQRFVCWLKIMGAGGVQTSTVLTATDFLGPYEIVRTDVKPLGMHAGDFDLVVEPSDGKAYYYFERVHSELICADLTDDYTGVTGYYSTHFARGHPPFVRESPAYFMRQGVHYLLTSGTTGYYPNPTELARADSYHGPWTVLGLPHVDDRTQTSFRSQISGVFKHESIDDLYIAIADRWLPGSDVDGAHSMAAFDAAYRPGAVSQEVDDPAAANVEYPNTSNADYVWLPITFEHDKASIHWRDEWRFEDFA